MGNAACCASKDAEFDRKATTQGDELRATEAVPLSDQGVTNHAPAEKTSVAASSEVVGVAISGTYRVSLDKAREGKLGLDVDYMAERLVLPIMAVTGGLAEDWNVNNPDNQMKKGDSIIEVNGTRHNVVVMLEKCKSETVLNLTLARAMTQDHLISDLENLVTKKNCGPILVRLSWHDAGVFMQGKGGCPNAAMRLPDSAEAKFDANKGLAVAMALLAPITQKYCPDLISNADLWALAANVAIGVMGGPDITTRFGRTDAKTGAEGVSSSQGRLPDGGQGVDHLRSIFHPKGFNDRDIVALSGAHTVGRCHLDRSGFEGPWTENPLKFDNTFFKELLSKTFTSAVSGNGQQQHRHVASGTMMLVSDMALLQDPEFKKHVQAYADDQTLWFSDFTKAWTKLQENGVENLLRDVL
mmetsp:Transcript_93876/g.205502  ORF Transcript_93876/g.205502 Transcript_93876/m.205502 type:complete len:413 (+) Transcript_93876:187-1425(+)